MIKHLIIIVFAGCMGLFVASCDGKTTSNSEKSTNEMSASNIDDPIVGTWVEPAVEGSLLGEVGFTLLKNGEVKSINTGFREYKSWERIGDQLVIRGMINGYNSQDFADTLNIVSVDEQQLVLSDKDGYQVTYQRKE